MSNENEVEIDDVEIDDADWDAIENRRQWIIELAKEAGVSSGLLHFWLMKELFPYPKDGDKYSDEEIANLQKFDRDRLPQCWIEETHRFWEKNATKEGVDNE